MVILMRTLEALEAILKSAQEPRAQVDAANTLAEYLVRADLVRCGLLLRQMTWSRLEVISTLLLNLCKT
jgi:hypothetical protein